MNSKLKQALREGARIEDISAGLAYAVVKNCFNKVLKVKDINHLGGHIVVQGGTFLNPAVLKATELFLGKQVIRPPVSALMGAFGCALTAVERADNNQQKKCQFNEMQALEVTEKQSSETIICDGCGNQCRISKMAFPGNRVYYSGNRCEKKYSNHNLYEPKRTDLLVVKNKLVFEQTANPPASPILTIGIPRVLNMYDNFPFWDTLFSALNIRVRLSSPTAKLNQQRAYGTIMSDNICYPAKLVHAHIFDLIDQQVDRIFYPIVRYEKKEFAGAVNAFNCPVVTGYPDVIKNVVNFEEYGIHYDMVTASFNNDSLLAKACYKYLKQFGIEKAAFQKAFEKAKARTEYIRHTLQEKGKKIIERARADKKPVIMLVDRPYHADPAVHHNIPGMICDMGVDVVTEDIVPASHHTDFKNDVHVLSQWQYSNRIYHALEWAGRQDNVHVIQLNSFGCGPDSIVMDEAKEIMEKYNKHYTMIRIDEGENPAPVKLRIRSLIESLNHQCQEEIKPVNIRQTTPLFCKIDRKKRILGPGLSQFYTLFTESLFFQEGYHFESLPQADRQSVETGLKYVNNDICYPAIILIGDIIKALQSGKYDLDNVAIAMSETGGQCRASNYVSLIKKAMLDAGYKHIPVISVSTNPNTMNVQPGFKKNFFEMLSLTLNILIYTDALLKLYNHVVVREKTKGEAKRIFDQYIQYAYQNRRNYVIRHSLQLLRQAVEEFNAVACRDVSFPKVGIVGEIFMKYNAFGNYQLEEWLRNNGMEVVTSPINSFFLESLADIKYNNDNYLEQNSWVEQLFHGLIEQRVGRYIRRVNTILEGFHHSLTRLHTIDEMQGHARDIVSLSHQYGEGWLLPAEMVAFAKEGVQNIVAVQPFGCIACHIVSKGVSKRIKEMFPDLNVLFLDMDADTSEANMHNRLEFFVRNAIASNEKAYGFQANFKGRLKTCEKI
jgi:predicted nucleotide-binding protein (sugar kinase/HSP70/actin superfamily)